jgi:hypothetical protein
MAWFLLVSLFLLSAPQGGLLQSGLDWFCIE